MDESGVFIPNEFEYIENTFKRRLTGNISIGLSTKLYGIISSKILSLHAIRHIISPSISYSFRPDFSNSTFLGLNVNYFGTDSNGDISDLFQGALVPSTSQEKRESYAFKINNDFYGKFFNNGEYNKIHLFNWKSSVSYNPTYDEFRWSYINSSIRTNIADYINLDVSLKHDMYELINNIRVNTFAPSPRLINLNSGIQLNLIGKKIKGFQQANTEKDTLDFDEKKDMVNSSEYYEPIISDNNLWEAGFSFRGSMIKKVDNNNSEYWDKNFWLDSNFEFNATKNWKISYSARFDLMNGEILSHNFIIYRPLHCWIFNFKWYPGIGENNYGSGFQLLIRVKNPDLQDIRLKHSSGAMFGF